jgi:hypothetical protein
MNIPGANGFCGAKPGGAKCFSPRMNTNEHEYYLQPRMLFGCHFLASIREDSRSFVANILFLDLYKHFAIVVLGICRDFPPVSGTPKQPSLNRTLPMKLRFTESGATINAPSKRSRHATQERLRQLIPDRLPSGRPDIFLSSSPR